MELSRSIDAAMQMEVSIGLGYLYLCGVTSMELSRSIDAAMQMEVSIPSLPSLWGSTSVEVVLVPAFFILLCFLLYEGNYLNGGIYLTAGFTSKEVCTFIKVL